MKDEYKIINMADVDVEEINWVWYPYIPYGKVTIIQGDPGEGKTTFALALVALLTTGTALPEHESGSEPINVIYQTAEDGLGDTIKPRLLAAGADCSRVLVIDELHKQLSLNDQRLEKAIQETGAKIVILDPLQAYLGNGVDMNRANEVRPVFKNLFTMAERTGCAIILIGHLNKAQGLQSHQRGMGSMDFRAATRSVLVVGRQKDNPNLRIVAHSKSSLAPEGRSIAFEIGENCRVKWKGYSDVSVDDLLCKTFSPTKTLNAEQLLKDMLKAPMSANEVFKRFADLDISERTVNAAKKNIGVISKKIDKNWVWSLPE